MPKGVYIRTKEHIEKLANIRKGLKHTEQARAKISKALIGRVLSNETRRKISNSIKGENHHAFGTHLSEETRKKISIGIRKSFTEEIRRKMSTKAMGRQSYKIGYENILKEIPELEKQGFRCIPIGKVIPDIVAVKDNKVYAIEIERGIPDYKKYTDEIRSYYDDIIWILRKKEWK